MVGGKRFDRTSRSAYTDGMEINLSPELQAKLDRIASQQGRDSESLVHEARWTSAAADNLENIANYLFDKTPENAARLIREIHDAPS